MLKCSLVLIIGLRLYQYKSVIFTCDISGSQQRPVTINAGSMLSDMQVFFNQCQRQVKFLNKLKSICSFQLLRPRHNTSIVSNVGEHINIYSTKYSNYLERSFAALLLLEVRYLSLSRSLAVQPIGPWPLFQFLNLSTVGRTPWSSEKTVARQLLAHTHTTTNTEWKQTDINASSGIRTYDPVFKRAKTVHALHRAATVNGLKVFSC
jgi:hypothetical protein